MSGLGTLLEDAGVGAFVVLLFAAVGFLLALIQLVLARRVDLAPLVVAAVPITLLAGAVGTLRELMRTFSALAMVEPDLKIRLAAAGTAEALAPLVLALVAALVQLLFASVALTVRANAAKPPV